MNMKKKAVSALLLSTVVLSAVAPATPIVATSTDDQIAQKDQTIQAAQAGAAQAKQQQDALQQQVDTAQNQLNSLSARTQKLNDDMKTLSLSIQGRQESLSAQARSAQVNGGGTGIINVILSSKSLSDMVQKVSAMSKIVSANTDMVKQQQKDQDNLKAAAKQSTDDYNKAIQVQQQLQDKQAQLKVAQLNYQATIATAQDQKNQLLAQKAAAEKAAAAAAAAAAAQAAARAKNNGGGVAGPSTAGPVAYGVSVNYGGGGTPSGGGSAYPVVPGDPYAGGGCTDFVWQYFHNKGLNLPGNLGNGGSWAYSLGPTSGPVAGQIVSFPPGVAGAYGPWGHVAVVTGVNADGTFNVIEGNYAGGGFGTTRTGISPAGAIFANS